MRRRPGRDLAERLTPYSYSIARSSPLRPYWLAYAGRYARWLQTWHLATWLDNLRNGTNTRSYLDTVLRP